MNMENHRPSLDEVLDQYYEAAEDFDADILASFIQKYPEYSQKLQQYAMAQMLLTPPTEDELQAVELPDEELLPMQSNLLKKLQELRGVPSTTEINQAMDKLATVSGAKATRAATISVFGSDEHGEDDLLVVATEEGSSMDDAPDWFFRDLASHIGTSPIPLRAGIRMHSRQFAQQRFSATDKPVDGPPRTWRQAVEECITDEATKRAILARF
jgi:hypothetical protein